MWCLIMATDAHDPETGNQHRIRDLHHLAEMMGSETTDDEAAMMRDLLVAAGFLDWTHDTVGGTLNDIGDDDWSDILGRAIRSLPL